MVASARLRQRDQVLVTERHDHPGRPRMLDLFETAVGAGGHGWGFSAGSNASG